MNPELAGKTIKDTFRQKFDDGRFLYFIRNLVNHLDESKKQTWTLKKAAFADFVNHFTRIGTYTDPSGERIDCLVVHLHKETTLARGRVTLRNFVADYLATGHGQGKAAVIAAFVSPQEDDWRFSFVKLDYTFEKTELGLVAERLQLTPARRYSYLVGKNENCHTAQKQFLGLLQSEAADPTVNQLESAFSVEKVTRDFFEHYRELFEKTRDALQAFLKCNHAIADHLNDRGIENDDFAKKLLGQIVFLYFLQKKGWFGVEPRKPWGSGRKDFIRHLFRERETFAGMLAKKAGRKSNFFNDILEPLFYEALAIDRKDNGDHYSLFDCKIPFLNGGLFEPLYGYQWQTTDILLPDALFSNDEKSAEEDIGTGILDVFDRYNFTVNEAEPLEKEVAVDPEMLGKVFENLLPEYQKHSSGTYYTPRVIVHYMCQQSLVHYIATHLPSIPSETIVLFLRLAERFTDFEANQTKNHVDKRLPDSIAQNADEIDKLLANVTVCDPAIGSGAFPVGMMHEIVRARMALTHELAKKHRKHVPEERTAYALKRHAIQHSLYGVDLDPGAVEIAKLRLWLSMVVDENDISDIQPLPNLDYKIMQGNSLLEEFEGVRLMDERMLQAPNEARKAEIVDLRTRISTLQAETLRKHQQSSLTKADRIIAEKALKPYSKRLNELLHSDGDLEQGELTQQSSWADLKRLQKLHADYFDEESRVQKEKLRKELDRLEWSFMEATLREQGREEAIAALKRASAKHRKPIFLWWLHFSEIKQRNNGFDIVLANPPFVRMELIKDDKPALKNRFPDLFSGRADLYVYFYGLGLEILREQGCLTFISSNTYLNSKFGEKLRKHLHETATISTLIDFAETKVFDAVVEPAIIVLRKAKAQDQPIRVVKWQESQPLDELPEVLTREAGFVRQASFTADPWRLESPVVLRLLDHLQKDGISVPLGTYVGNDVFYGVKSGLNEAFVIDAATREELLRDPRSEEIIKPFLRGRDISRWATQPVTSWLIYTHHSVDISRYPLVEKHLLPFKDALKNRATEQEWYELQQPQYRYSEFFKQPKIIYQDIARYFGMAWDDTGAFLANTCYFIPTREKWLLGILLSSTIQFHVQKTIGSDEGGFIRLFAMHVKKFPIPLADASQKAVIERLVSYLLWLHRCGLVSGDMPTSASGALLASYFEQWINALVYELFFPEVLHKAGLHFFRLADAADLRALEEMKKDQEFAELTVKFEELYATNQPLRQALVTLDSIDEIRTILGKT